MNVSVCVFGDSVLSASVENTSILVNKGFVIFALLFLLTLLLFFISSFVQTYFPFEGGADTKRKLAQQYSLLLVTRI